MTFYADNGKLMRRGGKILRGVECCPVKCGACKFFPVARAAITWSFTIAGASPDLNGGGQTWDDVDHAFHDSFAISHSGSVTAPVFLADVAGCGTAGDTRFSLEVTDPGTGATYNVTVIYDCAADKWGFVIAGPGAGIFISHDADPLHSTTHLGLMTGSCSGVTGTDAIFSTGPGGPEFTAVGSLSAVVSDNGCT